jgi:hypothetical protein
MGTVFAAATALAVTLAGAAASLSAPFGAAGFGTQYLAGHVLLGLGLGQSIAMLLRRGIKRLVAGRAAGRTPALAVAVPAGAVPLAVLPGGTPAIAPARPVPLTVLSARPAAIARLRGRHAA